MTRANQTHPHPTLQPIAGPASWVGKDMAGSDDWVYRLTPADIAEIDSAIHLNEAAGREIIDIGLAEFPLPTLGPKLFALRDEVLFGRGFVLMRGVPVERYDMRQAAMVYWGVGIHLGKPRSQNAKGHLLGHVRDLGYDVADPNVRVYQTTERQTYHTDSCDIVGLMCLKTAKRGGLSSIVSSVTVYNEMVRRRPDLAALLCEPFATDRRGEVPEGKKPYFMIPVFNFHEGRFSALYARRYIESARRFPEVPPLTPAQTEALNLFDSLAEDADLHLDMEFRPGDMQFICNHTILHDRTAFQDWPEPERKRHLLRLWLSPPNAQPLPPVYAERYGSIEIGDRGGIVVPGSRLNVPLEPV